MMQRRWLVANARILPATKTKAMILCNTFGTPDQINANEKHRQRLVYHVDNGVVKIVVISSNQAQGRWATITRTFLFE